MSKYLLFVTSLASAASGTSPDARRFQGVWRVGTDGPTVMQIEVRREPSGWSAIWRRPLRMALKGERIVHSEGPEIQRDSLKTRMVDAGMEIEFPDGDGGRDTLLLTYREPSSVNLSFIGLPKAVLPLTRVGNSDINERLDLSKGNPMKDKVSAEMLAIFEADQSERSSESGVEWKELKEKDGLRRRRVEFLLRENLLESADDLYYAAFIFQHGSGPVDFLKAHALAMAALAKGRHDASWIAAAALDRYLMQTQHAQIYGTQFHSVNGGPATQEPFDKQILTDFVREASGVPTLAEQKKQLLDLNATTSGPFK